MSYNIHEKLKQIKYVCFDISMCSYIKIILNCYLSMWSYLFLYMGYFLYEDMARVKQSGLKAQSPP